MTFSILCDKEPESQDLCRQEKTVYLQSIFKITTNESNNNLIVRVTWILRYLSVIVCVADNCTEYGPQFEKVFSVPGDVAMLNSTLLTSSVFNFSAVPYNITWYDSATAKEMTNQTSRILVRGETLWFLNVTKEDAGEYLTTVRYVGAESEVKLMCWSSHFCSSGHKTPFPPLIFTRTPTWCYKQATKLVVDQPSAECGRLRKASQHLTNRVPDVLSCPLNDYVTKLDSYNVASSITWYRVSDGKRSSQP